MPAIFLDYATVSFHGDLDPASLHRAMPGFELRDHTRQQDVGSAIAGMEVVLVNKLRITREVIDGAPDLRLIALAATGPNNIDLDAARERGVPVALSMAGGYGRDIDDTVQVHLGTIRAAIDSWQQWNNARP